MTFNVHIHATIPSLNESVVLVHDPSHQVYGGCGNCLECIGCDGSEYDGMESQAGEFV